MTNWHKINLPFNSGYVYLAAVLFFSDLTCLIRATTLLNPRVANGHHQ